MNSLTGLCPAASLRAELNHLHATALEHLKQIHLKENSATKQELETSMELSHKQVRVRRILLMAPSCSSPTTLSYAPSRNRSFSLRSQTCRRRCVPVATASPIWTMRSTLLTRPSVL